MGGLLALYALFSRPDVFGGAGALSPSLSFAGGAALDFLERVPHVGGRIYLDMGTREGAFVPLDRWLGGLPHSRPHVRAARTARRLLLKKGFREGRDLLYVEDRGALHGEAAWSHRLPAALRFLLGCGGGLSRRGGPPGA